VILQSPLSLTNTPLYSYSHFQRFSHPSFHLYIHIHVIPTAKSSPLISPSKHLSTFFSKAISEGQAFTEMAIRVPTIMHVKQVVRRSFLSGKEAAFTTKIVPKGYFAVYVGEYQKKRFILPMSYLNEPSFQKLLNEAAEEFGFDHPMGGLTIPCREEVLTDLTSRLNRL
jgi:SAUR family protein